MSAFSSPAAQAALVEAAVAQAFKQHKLVILLKNLIIYKLI